MGAVGEMAVCESELVGGEFSVGEGIQDGGCEVIAHRRVPFSLELRAGVAWG